MHGMAKTAAILALLLAFGCAPAEEASNEEARAESWATLETQKAELEDLRQQLKEARMALEAAPQEGEGADGEGANGEGANGEGEGEEGPAPLTPEQIADLETQVTKKADELMASLVTFINEDPMIEGEEPSPLQLSALRMKSDEDIELAREYIDKGGDYRRAIDILQQAQLLDPEYDRLQQELDRANDWRYVTEERFSQVKNGMTQAEVRQVLGQVFHRNVKEYAERNATGWFYAKDPEVAGGQAAAAVYFRESKGELKVFSTDWEAVKPEEQ